MSGEAPVYVELRAGWVLAPLQGMNVEIKVEQYVAQVEVITRFVNMEDNPIEAVYVTFFLFVFNHNLLCNQNIIIFFEV